ncbi:MAG: glycosyltransferase [Actinomycetota bacterium]|nr:glycosyltransferase [Actinomycetota bacterium]
MLDLSVIVPVRNAEAMLDECLASIARSEPREIILVDGMSTDGTIGVAGRYTGKILSDEGRGLPAARLLGAREASSRRVALIDADVVLPDGALASLLEEFDEGGYTALQAGLESVSGPGYWGQALAYHHRTGRSKDWFGLVATIFERDALLEHGFDPAFLSGEDIELRWRLQRSGARIGVSKRTVVTHSFDDTFDFARDQWLMDGRGLARMLGKHRLRALGLLALPAAAAARGIVLSLLRRQPIWIPYYALFAVFNYVGMVEALTERWRTGETRRTSDGAAHA